MTYSVTAKESNATKLYAKIYIDNLDYLVKYAGNAAFKTPFFLLAYTTEPIAADTEYSINILSLPQSFNGETAEETGMTGSVILLNDKNCNRSTDNIMGSDGGYTMNISEDAEYIETVIQCEQGIPDGAVFEFYVPDYYYLKTGGTPYFAGDANGDAKVNLKDVLAIRKYVSGAEAVADHINADVDGDYSVTSKDSLLLRKHIAGYEVTIGHSSIPAMNK